MRMLPRFRARPTQRFGCASYRSASTSLHAPLLSKSRASSMAMAKPPESEPARLIACSTACLFISLAGSLGFIYGAKGALALACGFAMKLFGAPLTIALVCCYSRIKKADSTKASLIGISGAFVAQSILSSINVQQLWHPSLAYVQGSPSALLQSSASQRFYAQKRPRQRTRPRAPN